MTGLVDIAKADAYGFVPISKIRLPWQDMGYESAGGMQGPRRYGMPWNDLTGGMQATLDENAANVLEGRQDLRRPNQQSLQGSTMRQVTRNNAMPRTPYTGMPSVPGAAAAAPVVGPAAPSVVPRSNAMPAVPYTGMPSVPAPQAVPAVAPPAVAAPPSAPPPRPPVGAGAALALPPGPSSAAAPSFSQAAPAPNPSVQTAPAPNPSVQTPPAAGGPGGPARPPVSAAPAPAPGGALEVAPKPNGFGAHGPGMPGGGAPRSGGMPRFGTRAKIAGGAVGGLAGAALLGRSLLKRRRVAQAGRQIMAQRNAPQQAGFMANQYKRFGIGSQAQANIRRYAPAAAVGAAGVGTLGMLAN